MAERLEERVAHLEADQEIIPTLGINGFKNRVGCVSQSSSCVNSQRK